MFTKTTHPNLDICLFHLPSQLTTYQSTSFQMIMLKEYIGAVELRTALSLTSNNSALLIVHCAIQKAVNQQTLRVFSYPFDRPIFWFILDVVKNSRPFVHIAKAEEDNQLFTAGVRQFFNSISNIVSEDGFDVAAEAIVLHNVMTVLDECVPGLAECSSTAYTVFFMSAEQQDNARKVRVKLPYGYEFSSLAVADAKGIQEAVGGDDSAALIGDRICNQPSTGIIHAASGKLVTHQLSSSRGDMLHLYTDPEHRRQGLGLAAELTLAQKIIAASETPVKVVPNYLSGVLTSSEDSPFWTMWQRERLPVQFIIKHVVLN